MQAKLGDLERAQREIAQQPGHEAHSQILFAPPDESQPDVLAIFRRAFDTDNEGLQRLMAQHEGLRRLVREMLAGSHLPVRQALSAPKRFWSPAMRNKEHLLQQMLRYMQSAPTDAGDASHM